MRTAFVVMLAALVAAAPASAASKPKCSSSQQLVKRVKVKKKRDRHGRLRRHRVVSYRCVARPAPPVVGTPGVTLPGQPEAQTDPGTAPATPPSTSFLTVTVTDQTGLKMIPSRGAVPYGTVNTTFVNSGDDPHNLNIRAGSGPSTPLVAEALPGDHVPVSFQVSPGSYTLFCSLPGHDAMQAPLTVQ